MFRHNPKQPHFQSLHSEKLFDSLQQFKFVYFFAVDEGKGGLIIIILNLMNVPYFSGTFSSKKRFFGGAVRSDNYNIHPLIFIRLKLNS